MVKTGTKCDRTAKAIRIQIFAQLPKQPTKNAKLTNDSRSHEDVVKIVSGDQLLIRCYKNIEIILDHWRETEDIFCSVSGFGSSIACCLLTNILSRYAEK